MRFDIKVVLLSGSFAEPAALFHAECKKKGVAVVDGGGGGDGLVVGGAFLALLDTPQWMCYSFVVRHEKVIQMHLMLCGLGGNGAAVQRYPGLRLFQCVAVCALLIQFVSELRGEYVAQAGSSDAVVRVTQAQSDQAASRGLAAGVAIAATVDEISFTASQILWTRIGNLPAFWATTFEFSNDGSRWTYLGEGTKVGNEWRIQGLPELGDGIIRARGYLTSSNGDPSGLFSEKRFEFTTSAPVIVRNATSPIRTSGGFSFQISGKIGQLVLVEASTDLVVWKRFPVKRLTGAQTWFADAEAKNLGHRFYRVLLAP